MIFQRFKNLTKIKKFYKSILINEFIKLDSLAFKIKKNAGIILKKCKNIQNKKSLASISLIIIVYLRYNTVSIFQLSQRK
jgi:hypothetical protein